MELHQHSSEVNRQEGTWLLMTGSRSFKDFLLKEGKELIIKTQ
jgi:hypothetical protein